MGYRSRSLVCDMDIESSHENVSVYTVDVGEGVFISAEKSIDEKSEDAISGV